MRIRRFVAVLAVAAPAFWTPLIIPVKAFPLIRCGMPITEYHAIDTAYATEPLPCPVSRAPTSAPVIVLLVGTVSVMLNAAIVWSTQCRELSSEEAMTSAFLPLIGIALDAKASQCH
jgi:hypothetical protein